MVETQGLPVCNVPRWSQQEKKAEEADSSFILGWRREGSSPGPGFRSQPAKGWNLMAC